MATKTKKNAGFQPLRTGYDPRKDKKQTSGEGNGGNWLKLEAGKPVDVTILVEKEDIITCEQSAIWLDDGNSPVWVFTGPDDPSIELDIERRYRAYLPVLMADGSKKVWGMGKMAHTQLLEIADAVGELKGLNVRLKRTGAGLNTRYNVINRGSRRDVDDEDEVDVVAMLDPKSPDEVRDMIAEKLGLSSWDEVLRQYKGKKGVAKSKSQGKTKPVAPVEDDDDDDDEEDEDIEDLDLE